MDGKNEPSWWKEILMGSLQRKKNVFLEKVDTGKKWTVLEILSSVYQEWKCHIKYYDSMAYFEFIKMKYF